MEERYAVNGGGERYIIPPVVNWKLDNRLDTSIQLFDLVCWIVDREGG